VEVGSRPAHAGCETEEILAEQQRRRRAMAEYEFECRKCGKQFTIQETIKEHGEHHEKCPKCGSKQIEQLVSTVFAKTSKKS
jgi:putative FmdB family regulatory protein